MHVEFRFSEVSRASLFDCESFFRVKQLASLQTSSTSRSAPSDVPSLPNRKKELVDLTALAKQASDSQACLKAIRSYKPKICIQIVFEKVVKFETTEISVKLDSKQHEKQYTTNWDGSEIRTKRYSTRPREVVLASLPLKAADCVLKIRLLQMPPTFNDVKMNKKLEEILPKTDNVDCSKDSPICVGVAKITLKELMGIRGGVCISLQAKQTLIRLVEELNLNTVATNGMFGKDIGGSAFFSLQVVHYAFGKIPIAKLLLNPTGDAGSTTGADDRASQTSDRHFDSSTDYALNEQLNSPAMRFAIVPYIAVVDFIIRVNDVISWRNPKKTLVLLMMLLLAITADILGVVVVVFLITIFLITVRTTFSLYHVPPADTRGGPLVTPMMRKGKSEDYLYSKSNTLLNALIRSRLFFAQGLQKDCFYELAFILHSVRRSQRDIVVGCLTAFVAITFLSVESLLLLSLFLAFFTYPISLNLPTWNSRKVKKSDPSVLTSIMKAFRVNRPMCVVRIIQVSVLDTQSREPSTLMLETKQHTMSIPEAVARSSRMDRVETGSGVSHNTSVVSAPFPMHLRAQTMDFVPGEFYRPERQQMHNLANLSFAVVVFRCDAPISGSATYAGTNRSGNCSQLVRKLREHFEYLRAHPISQLSNEELRAYFKNTSSLLYYIRQQCSMQVYTAPVTSKSKSNNVRLDFFARAAWLIERGTDDGITTTILETSNHMLVVEKMAKKPGASDDARSMALLAAHLLQGSRLSVYYSGTGSIMCCTILPLTQGSEFIQRQPPINPCPQSLFNTLEDIWRGTVTNSPTNAGESPMFTIDTVLSIINTYSEQNVRSSLMVQQSHGAGDMGNNVNNYTHGDNNDAKNAGKGKSSQRPSFFAAFQSAPRQSSVQGNYHSRTQSNQIPYGALTENRRTNAYGSPHTSMPRNKEISEDSRRQVSQALSLDGDDTSVSPQSKS